MAELIHLYRDPHEQTQKLLPWYVNNTLGDDEAAMVDAHLAECTVCAEELLHERALRAGVASLGVDVDDGWAAMRERIAATPTVALSAPRIPLWRRRVPLGRAIAAQALAAGIAAVVILSLPASRPGTRIYHALGTPASVAPGNAIILFAPDTSASRIRATLDAASARVLDGPLASGAYLIRVPAGSRTTSLAKLRTARGVTLAEPLDKAGTP